MSRRLAATNRGLTMRGFTLLEVMVGLALLGLALTVLLKSAANSIFNARQAQMLGVVTDLARAKMYDIEELLLKDGFSETDQSENCVEPGETLQGGETFEAEGWPLVRYGYCVQQVELPSWDALQQMAKPGAGSGAGSAIGSAGSGLGSDFAGDVPGGFQDSALGGMLSMLGGGMGGEGGGDIDSQMGASFIQGQYSMVQDVLQASIRKVSLTVAWEVSGSARELKVVTYFTDAASMDKVLSGLGSQELTPDSGAGAGSGSGSGAGSTRAPRDSRTGSGARP